MADRMDELNKQNADLLSIMGNQQSRHKIDESKPNVLKKKSSHPTLLKKTSQANIKQQSTTLKNNANEQPWVTAHLNHTIYGMETAKSTRSPAPTRRRAIAPTSPPPPVPSDPDAITSAPPRFPAVHIDSYTGHSNVTLPAAPPQKYRFSELIDLDDLGPTGHVRSPSGNMLSVAQAALREDRPRSIRERQERIRQRVEAAKSGLGNEVEIVGDAKKREKMEEERTKRRESLKGKAKEWSRCYCQ